MTSQLLIHESPLQVFPTLAREIGLNEAIVLQQIHYWLNLEFSRSLIYEHYWVRYIPEQWERQFSFWDKKTLHRAINTLEKLEMLVSIETEDSGKAKYYAIDYGTLSQVTSGFEPESTASSSTPSHDHANFDAINFVETKGGN